MEPTTVLIGYAAWSLLLSLVTFVTYGWDKRSATRGKRRVAERTLHWMELLGGWAGGWLGQRVWRHKTQKTSYRVIFWLIGVLHLGVAIALVYWYSTT